MEAIAAAGPAVLGVARIPVAQPEALVIYKAVAWRPQDQQDVERLLALRGAHMDLARIRRHVRELEEAMDEDRIRELDAGEESGRSPSLDDRGGRVAGDHGISTAAPVVVPDSSSRCARAASARWYDGPGSGAIAAVRAGVGVAALPSFLAARDPELVRITARGRPVAREVWLVVHEDLRGAPSIRAVMDFLVAATADLR